MKLKVLSNYSSAGHGFYFQAGAIVEVTPEEHSFLTTDSPGSFEDYVEPEAKAPDAPPADKAVKRAPAKKSTRRRRSTK